MPQAREAPLRCNRTSCGCAARIGELSGPPRAFPLCDRHNPLLHTAYLSVLTLSADSDTIQAHIRGGSVDLHTMREETASTDRSESSSPAGNWSLPLPDPFPAAAERLGPQRIQQIVWAFIALGIMAGLVRYLLWLPLWPDEAYLAHNFLHRGYLDLMKSLDFIQIAPLLYLWVQATFIKIFGFSEYSLRLYTLLCGIGSLLLFWRLAGRVLRGTAFLLAVGTFAVAYPLVRHSAEAKPYGADVFVSMIMLTLLVEWLRRPQERRWAWALVVVMPLAVGLSYPAVFFAGGIVSVMALVLWQRGSRGDWLRWAAAVATLSVGMAALFALSARNQMAASAADQRAAYATSFPPSLTSPGKLILFVLANTNEALVYPAGGAIGPNLLTSLCCLTALVLLIRGRRFFLVVLCLVPLALNFAAAALHCYPYGEPWRFAVYLVPIFCLLTALGAAAILSTMKLPRWGLTPVAIILTLLAAIAVGGSVREFLKPYKEPCWMRNRDFARWFWFDKAQDAELVCLWTDLHERFYSPPEGDDLASVYYCNQRIYSPRLAKGEPPHLDRVSKSRPLRCVRYRPANTTDRQEAAFQEWLKSQLARYDLVAQEKQPLCFWVKDQLKCTSQVEVYDFVPKTPVEGARMTAVPRSPR